ncbi:MAG: ComF family protein [Lachnospiraceae bacterium]|nr:ComF family protein [Lachnospiraceae bacterium]
MQYEKLTRAGRKILPVLYPSRCPLCDHRVKGETLLCPNCRGGLPLIKGKRCRVCSKPISEGESLCGDCRRVHHEFDRALGILLYDDRMRRSLSWLKYKGRAHIGLAWGRFLYLAAGSYMRACGSEVLVPVPVHEDRLKKRGYNQADVLAKGLSKASGLPVVTGAVVRRGQTGALKTMDRSGRAGAMRQAFGPGAAEVAGRRVLIVDDIYTTGATADAVSRVLLDRGAASVSVLTVCIGAGVVLK